MRVLVTSSVFPPEPVISAQTSVQISVELVRRGHEVTVLTAFPSKPAGRIYPGYRRRFWTREKTEGGCDLVRCFSFPSAKSSIASRLLENLSFGITSACAALVSNRPQVIYAVTWPIFATGFLLLVARLRKIPMVISIQDVYPESLITQQRLPPSSIVVRWLRWIDARIARACRAVIVISERFADVYRKDRKVPVERLSVVPNWVHVESLVLEEPSQRHRLKLGIPEEAFLLVYGGNIGMAAGVETLVAAFRHLEHRQRAYLLIAGEGANLAACRRLAREISTNQIAFRVPWPVDETSTVLHMADLLVLPTRGIQSLVSVPSKLITYMLAGRAILVLAYPSSEAAAVIEEAQCGWVIEPDQPELVAAKVEEIMSLDREELARLGANGRSFALRNYTAETCLPVVIEILERAASR